MDGSDASNSGADLVDLGHGAGKKTGLLIRHGAGNALEYILGIYLTWRGRILRDYQAEGIYKIHLWLLAQTLFPCDTHSKVRLQC